LANSYGISAGGVRGESEANQKSKDRHKTYYTCGKQPCPIKPFPQLERSLKKLGFVEREEADTKFFHNLWPGEVRARNLRQQGKKYVKFDQMEMPDYPSPPESNKENMFFVEKKAFGPERNLVLPFRLGEIAKIGGFRKKPDALGLLSNSKEIPPVARGKL